jgi:predicted chitinase
VLLRHQTAIGGGENAGDIVFFSLYMHLASVPQSLAAGRRVFRKAELGQAGQIYGDTRRQIHFEVLCDDVNLHKLVGRASGEVELTRNGRVDAVYGAAYFMLPVGVQVFAQEPVSHLASAHFQPPKPNARSALPPLVALTASYTSSAPQIVELHYAAGAGAVGHRGELVITTRQLDGEVVGQVQRQLDAEYGMYEKADATSRAFHAPNVPAPSTVYELLRFGRTVNGAHEAQVGVNVPHWRKISYPGGEGWVNLNAEGIYKFSDADFPQWRGWSLIDDSSDGDSHCDSATIKGWLDTDGDGKIVVSEAIAMMADARVAGRLAKAICKLPSEWAAATIDARWGWLMNETAENTPAMNPTDFAQLKAHITALCFDAPELQIATWHWHPLQFLRHFRQCSWLSLNELCQLLPRRSGTDAAHLSEIPWATAIARFTPYYQHLNVTMRKYGMVSRVRQAHFLAQTYIETALWRTMEELGRAHQQRRRNGQLYWPAPAMEYYQAFYGRGAMQLTWAGNFDKYGIYRAFTNVAATHQYVDNRITRTSTHYWGDPREHGVVVRQPRVWWPRYDPHDIVSEPFYSCDSAAFYWVSTNTGGGRLNIHRVADQGLTTDAIGRASVLVNGGGYGYPERQAYAVYIDRYLGDGVESEPTRSFVVTHGQRNHNVR